jgi:transcriptional regulator with XRE-family HTH domain
MKFSSAISEEAILEELGARMTRVRLDLNLSQRQLAERAGVSLRTLARMERGEVAVQLSVFVRLCGALGLLEAFDLLLPESTIGPMEELRFREKGRKRASSKANSGFTSREMTTAASLGGRPDRIEAKVGLEVAHVAERIAAVKRDVVKRDAAKPQWVWGDER